MKLAMIADEFHTDLNLSLDILAEYGVQGVELRRLWDKDLADAPRHYWQRAKKELDARGILVAGIASSFYYCTPPAAEPEGPAGPLHSASALGLGDQISLLERSIEAALFFETNLVSTYSFWKEGLLTPAQEEALVDAYAEPTAMAERAGIILGIENNPACCLGTGAQLARVLAEINSHSVRGVWAPGNAFLDGEQPFPTGYEAIQEFLVHVRVKDAAVPVGAVAPECAVFGTGAIDYAGQFAALKDDGYTGWISLEMPKQDLISKEAFARASLDGLERVLTA